MYRLWLIFSQAPTVADAVLVTVSTFHPEWLPSRAVHAPPIAVVQQAPVPPSAAASGAGTESLHGAVERATPSVVNVFTSKEVRVPRHPLLDDPLFGLGVARPEPVDMDRVSFPVQEDDGGVVAV